MSTSAAQPGADRRSDVGGRRPLKIALVGSARFGVGEPYAGGLEAHTVMTARSLLRAGHDVRLFAGPADRVPPPDLDVVAIVERTPDSSGLERADTEMRPEAVERVRVGYQRVLEVIGNSRFDIVHNNSLHVAPVDIDGNWEIPMVHVLHCPPFEELERAHYRRSIRLGEGGGDVISVSRSLHDQWNASTAVVPNGVRVDEWVGGRSASDDRRCVWAGRIVEDKGVHLALDAARLAGFSIVIAGPIQQQQYFDDLVAPRLGPHARWIGHATHAELKREYARSTVGVVSPRWDEPFGLVIAEMLAAGLPVAATDRGVIRDIVGPCGVVADGDDAHHLADAINEASTIDRSSCRRWAACTLSDDAMVAHYQTLYHRAMAKRRLVGIVRSAVAP